MNKALQTMPVVVLTGARQTGKTTLVKHFADHGERVFLTFDQLDILEQARTNPDALLKRLPVTIDEVQRCPEFLLAVKRCVDAQRQPGMILLTGSANLLLLKNVSESLAGRAYYMELPPFVPTEWEQACSTPNTIDQLFEESFNIENWPDITGDWLSWVLRGGFPSVLELRSDEERDIWYSGYVATYLERDLRQLSNVESLPDFQRCMRIASNRIGRLLNQSELARDAALSQATCHRYLNLLETGYQISRIPPYTTNLTKRLIKAKKFFWNDCGLGAWLADIESAEHLTRRMDLGFWFEQAFFQILQVWKSLAPSKRKIFFWRDQSGREVDFVIEKNSQLVAIELKAGSEVRSQDLKNLQYFHKILSPRERLIRSVVFFNGTSKRYLDDHTLALPCGVFFPRM